MKVLGISGSPRVGGNTDHAVLTALRIIGERLPDAETEFIQITDLRIEHCRGCRHCMEAVECIIRDDDLDLLVGKMLAADLVILGAPVYWLGPPGVMKDFIDRTHGFYPDRKRFAGKKVAIISVAADSGWPTHERIMSWLQHYGAEIVGRLRLLAREKDELKQRKDQLGKLEAFADSLIEHIQGPHPTPLHEHEFNTGWKGDPA